MKVYLYFVRFQLYPIVQTNLYFMVLFTEFPPLGIKVYVYGVRLQFYSLRKTDLNDDYYSYQCFESQRDNNYTERERDLH